MFIKANKEESRMLGQMCNYLYNGISSEIVTREDYLFFLPEDQDEPELVLDDERVATIKKMIQFFLEDMSDGEFHTHTGFTFAELKTFAEKLVR